MSGKGEERGIIGQWGRRERPAGFDVLSGGVVPEAIHELPWSKCCATVIHRYGVCWWISI
nr:hypothetical protein [uncultured Acetatifactor sp.]